MPLLRKLVSTYSIVAIDHQAELMGAAVQSHFFAVGSVISWARAGVGVVATQSLVKPEYGPRALSLLEHGLSPSEVLSMLTSVDEAADVRQVAVLSPTGAVAHTGARCIPEAGHISKPGFTAQANMMKNTGVPEAMAHAFEATAGGLAHRMTAALAAAEAQGGDIRGRQSAALVLVSTKNQTEVRKAKPLELRVDDHPEPVEELQRLLRLHEAYADIEAGDDALAENDFVEAGRLYQRAREAAPDNLEMRFWEAMGRAAAGDIDTARVVLKQLDGQDRCWRELAHRLPATGLISIDREGWERLLAP